MHERNLTTCKTLDRVAEDPRVTEVRDEGSDGYWVDLVRGYNFEGQCSLRGETVREVLDLMRLVEQGDPY